MSVVAGKINVNIRLRKSLKEQVEQIAREMWLSFTAIVNILLTKLIKERSITLHADHAVWTSLRQDEWDMIQEESGEALSQVRNLIRESD